MGTGIHRVYLFGDQTYDYDNSFRQLLSSENSLLKSFFEKTFSAIRAESSLVPSLTKDLTPRYSSFADLLSRKREACLSPALEQALCVVHSLAHFIWRHSNEGIPYPTARDCHILGICTGALAAAAISASSNLFDLIPHAVDAVVAAFHCGLIASGTGRSISGDTADAEASWSWLLPGVNPESAQELINEFRGGSLASRLYLSANVFDNATVSGPPRVLSQLRTTDKLGRLVHVALPIKAPYHAAHLYDEEQSKEIVQHISKAATHHSGHQTIPIISCGTGQSDWSTTLSGKLETAVKDILISPVMMKKAMVRLEECIRFAAPCEVRIIPIGTCIGESVRECVARAVFDASVVLDTTTAANRSMKFTSLRGPMDRPKIAVIGMSGRFPGASDVDGLWELLMNKIDMCREVPSSRWDVETHVDPSGKDKNKSQVGSGCWIDNAELFDARFFSISPREALQVDPAQRIALLTAYEAMEKAGIVPGRTPSTREDRVGVFYGVASNDWCEANSNQAIDTYFIPGANRAFIPGRINFNFKFSGPSYAVDTACSSSLSAIHIAYNSLLQGDIDMAIAGGTNVLTNPDMTCGLDRGHFLSRTGNCKTFDASADGYCRGEGVGTVILKRLEDAIQDHDPILGVISGAFTNHSAEAVSITRPHVGAQRDILNRVLGNSGTNPYDVSYVEMHGTGTQAGDTGEMQSVCSVFAPSRGRTADQPLHLGALKANIGHGESVSGVSALIKVLLMMQHNVIPPNCGIKTQINPAFPKDLKERQVFIDSEAAEWQRPSTMPRKAIVNNFSAAGGNSTILLEDAPNLSAADMVKSVKSRPTFPVAVSARSPKSLTANLKTLLHHIQSQQPDLAKLSYTTTARRMHHAHRVLVVGSSLQEIEDRLNDALSTGKGATKAMGPKKLLFTFTGQGSQYAGMGKRLYEELSVFRHQLQRLDRLVQSQGFPSILDLFTADASTLLSDFQPIVVQLAATCIQIALARIYMSWGLKPTSVVGHSLGEYAALNVAGVLSDADTIYLVGKRAQLMQNLCESGSHAMLAVMASESEIDNALAKMPFEVSCVNGPKEVVISGTVTQVAKMRDVLAATGIRATLLKTPYAFHTSQVDPVRAPFVRDAHLITFNSPKIPVLSSLSGTVVDSDGVFSAEYVGRQMRERVQMMQALRAGADASLIDDKTYGIEFGPHPVVAGMVKSTLGSAVKVLPTLRRNADPFEVLTESLSAFHNAGASISWDEYFRDIPHAQSVIPLPAYNWDLQPYWINPKKDCGPCKGDLQLPAAQKLKLDKASEVLPPKPVTITEAIPTLESSTIHRIVREEVSSSTFSITTECDVGREDVNHVMQGHKVDGIGLCTPSIYGDIGFSLGTYVTKRFKTASLGAVVNVSDMNIEKAFIASAKQKQFLRCTATVDFLKKDATCVFSTHHEDGDLIHQHATCHITFADDSNRLRLQEQLAQTKARFEEMRSNCSKGKTYRFNNAMAYNMVSKLAEFDSDYMCIDEIVYDNDNYEAACTVSFEQMRKQGKFHAHPAALDGLTQSGGFAMNVNESTNLEKEVFINHGWDGFELYETIRHDCQYQTHVKMSPADNAQWKGDIIIFTGDRLVGFVHGVCLQGVPRRVLKYILASSAAQPKAAPVPSKAASAQVQGNVQAPSASKSVADTRSTPLPPPGTNAVPPASRLTDDGQAEKVLEIIAKQVLIDKNSLTDSTCFEDIGIDSLLMLVISGSLMEELGISIEPTFFVDFPTVAHVKEHFKSSSTSSSGNSLPISKPAVVTPEPASPPILVPESTMQVPQQEVAAPEKRAKSSISAGVLDKALAIISEETGVEVANLTDQLELAEAGVDSLLLLILSSRFCEELGLDVQPDQLAEECVTVAKLKSFVARRCGLVEADKETEKVPAISMPMTLVFPGQQLETQPAVSCDTTQSRSTEKLQAFMPSNSSLQPVPRTVLPHSDAFDNVLNIVAEETGVARRDLMDTADIAEVGIDSMLSLVIASRLRDELNIDLGPDSVLLSLQTMGQLRAMIEGESYPTIGCSTPEANLSSCDSNFSGQIDTDVESASSDGELIDASVPDATSVILQGNPRTAHKVLFFFPDGSGSATSYAQLPRIRDDLVVYGLNSPFLKNGDAMSNVVFDDLVQSYVAEIRRRHPYGPYSFAGWSAGGTLAFRAAQLLIESGEQVTDLVLLDAPAPGCFAILPQRFYDFCQSHKIFGGESSCPSWLLTHFRGMNRILSKYNPDPCNISPPRNVHLVWATKGSFEGKQLEKRPEDPEDFDFLLNDRSDFTPGGWAKLLPGVAIRTAKADGETHFTMLKGASAQKISNYIRHALV